MAEIPVERREKSAFPWWIVPLLLLLLLLPLLYFTCGRNNNVAVVDNSNNNRAGTMSTNSNTVLTSAGNTIGNGVNTVANSIDNAANRSGVTTGLNNNSGAGNAGGSNPAGANSQSGANGGDGRAVEAVNYFGTVDDKNTIVGRNANFRTVRVNRVLSDKVFTVKSEDEEMFVMLDEGLDSGGGKEQGVRIRPGMNVKLAGTFRTVPTSEVNAEQQGGGLNQKEYAQMKDQKVYLHASGIGNAP